MISTSPQKGAFEARAATEPPLHPMRLIVLVPGELTDPVRFAQVIFRMACQQKREVLYLALADQAGDPLATDRLLATLKSMTNDPMVPVRSLMLEAASWVDAVRFVYQPGDLVVCHEAQRVRVSWQGQDGLGEYLDSQYAIRVHLLDGFYRGSHSLERPGWAYHLLFWLGFLATLTLFTFLEMRMEILLTGGIRTLILAGLVCAEFGLIYKLNNWGNR